MIFPKQGTHYANTMKKGILTEILLLVILAAAVVKQTADTRASSFSLEKAAVSDYIKWVDFTVSYEALCKAYEWDVDTYGSAHEIDWIDLLACTAAATGGEFDKKALSSLNKTAKSLAEGKATVSELAQGLKYFSYYKEVYEAVLGGMLGEFEEESVDENGEKRFQTVYGLKAYFPLAKGFDYTHYDDFGAGRSFGYQRKHLGHDMMGQIGTPIIAIESGYVEALGWNAYGGWRIGIRSFDGKRYYYYAHLRQNYPYAENLENGSVVTAGDVIGYMGHTGYSTKENVNNIKVVHLHWGMELIFDESQKEGDNEVWIDVYPLTRFLARHAQAAEKKEGSREWVRSTRMRDPLAQAALGKK
ncbi:MAG: M23 family metallopeptidase [Clostridium sp.]|jgi:murein DD-endopeptidase MepM/ murein hydrolase activator NlpD|nr:M23 family metallopeptidase [Clostridium sp.]